MQWLTVLLKKLQPFFPPLEQLRSANLRAALFRSFLDLKKSGIIGQETVVQKIILDECKGREFEGILASFSTAVLWKALESKRYGLLVSPAAVRTERLLRMDYNTLLSLILAHRASITSLVRERNNRSSAYREFGQLLNLKGSKLSREFNPSQSSFVRGKSQQNIEQVKKAWHGEKDWSAILIDGGSSIRSEPTLQVDFPQVWSELNKGGNTEESLASLVSSDDLFSRLDNRLKRQQFRIQQWHEFKSSFELEGLKGKTMRPQSKVPLPVFRDLPTGTNAHNGASAQRSGHNQLAKRLQTHLQKLHASLAQKQAPILTQPSVPDEASPSNTAKSTKDRSKSVSNRHSWRNKGTYNVRRATMQTYPAPEIETACPITESHTYEDQQGIVSNAILRRTNTLLDRTRKSMSLLPALESPVRQAVPKKQRHSQVFPVNPFEPYHKPDSVERIGAMTPMETLFSDDAEYSSVFKSRPKVSTSPVSSPTLDSTAQGDTPFVDDTEEVSFFEMENSPLANVRPRGLQLRSRRSFL